MRRCLKGLGGFPTSTDGFILGPSHGTVGRLDLLQPLFVMLSVEHPSQSGGCSKPKHPCLGHTLVTCKEATVAHGTLYRRMRVRVGMLRLRRSIASRCSRSAQHDKYHGQSC